MYYWSHQEHRRHQKAARDSRVVMYRKYRVGELPDIQIKHSELIRPFQALAQVNIMCFVKFADDSEECTKYIYKTMKRVGGLAQWSENWQFSQKPWA